METINGKEMMMENKKLLDVIKKAREEAFDKAKSYMATWTCMDEGLELLSLVPLDIRRKILTAVSAAFSVGALSNTIGKDYQPEQIEAACEDLVKEDKIGGVAD